jgi:hypothetical protein
MTEDSRDLLDNSFYLAQNSQRILVAEERHLRAQSIEDDLIEEEKILLNFLHSSAQILSKRMEATFREAKDITLMDKANKKLVK